jgi:hypothetical protein
LGGQWLARQKSSLDAARVKNDPAFARTLENAAEFALAARTGKVLRHAVASLYKQALGKSAMTRVNQLMLKIKMLDGVSVRGQRHAGAVQYLPEAQSFMKGFEFGKSPCLGGILKVPVEAGTAPVHIGVNGLEPQRDLAGPQGASHAVFSGCVARIDFGQGTYAVEKTNEVVVDLEGAVTDVELVPAAVPGGTGILLLCLRVFFVQERAGVKYVLEDKDADGCVIVGVG